MDKDMYTAMDMASDSPVVARGNALHKMVRPAPPGTGVAATSCCFPGCLLRARWGGMQPTSFGVVTAR